MSDKAGARNQAAYEMVKDAMRYRWLRSHGSCPFSEQDAAWDSPEALDKAVDECMEHEEEAQ